MDEDGNWVEEEPSMVEEDPSIGLISTNYFKKLFSTSNPKDISIGKTLDNIPKKVTEAHNRSLSRPFTKSEVGGL